MKYITISLVVLFFTQGFSQTGSGSFSTAITKQYNYNYLLHKPKSTTTKKPLLIFLHGSGEKGNDLEKVKSHGPFDYLKSNELDAYVLAPQCPQEAYWESESLHQLIQKVIKENNNIDTNRIYLTGLSMGAWGAWNLAFAHPETFAALVPICGFVDRVPMIENCKIANIPTRIFHGLVDDVVDVNYSITIYKKLKGCSKDLELTIFDDANHDSWTRVYNNAAIYEWMFQQIKK
ncbi:prolyl oligopeptidase family serine peptidase [Flavobacterium azooxidireducens]|uniref:Prolyl oligopeptidase family serine peptidase n=1 Tax=Flavobacterium azooxidireducens TaxID=1871076 RepID=A0ABY4KC60_9FLAO|nr:prolyl oligopeptidase family serine peptidase [Flavobacterium azooxidireducens]UPQ78361.1 prolyl oligopeptidase family serine peptidase [Flavobacterium azooxidireducens]